MPYESRQNNYLNIFNTAYNLFVSYLILQVNAYKEFPEEAVLIGSYIEWTLYISWSANFIFIV